MNGMLRFILEKLRPHADRRTGLVAFATSNRGLVRRDNQDSFVCDAQHAFLCVADGMGGGAEGATASRWACEDISAACLAAGDDVAAREEADLGRAEGELRIRSEQRDRAAPGVLPFLRGAASPPLRRPARPYFAFFSSARLRK